MNRTGTMLTAAGNLALPMTTLATEVRVFAADVETVTPAVMPHEDGRFEATLSETMFWGGMTDHSLTAICRLDPA
jgi:hypothetical protein